MVHGEERRPQSGLEVTPVGFVVDRPPGIVVDEDDESVLGLWPHRGMGQAAETMAADGSGSATGAVSASVSATRSDT